MRRLDPKTHTYTVERISGKGRGKLLGIATLNFKIPANFTLPYGVYAAWVTHNKQKHQAAVHFGPRPTFAETDPSLEAYILDGNIVVQNNSFELAMVAQVRGETTFNFTNQEALLMQISQDIQDVGAVLKE